MSDNSDNPDIEALLAALPDRPAVSPHEVLRRSEAADALGSMGVAARSAMPHLLQSLVVPVGVDCGLVLRVSAAAAIWKIDGRVDIVLPFLAWALKDEYWGVAPRAVEALAEIGHAEVVPDLVRLAERRLGHGPFMFEEFSAVAGTPFLVLIAKGLGRCGCGLSNGRSFAPEAKEMLLKLADYGDEQLREAALTNLEELTAIQQQYHPPRSCERQLNLW